ncbi:MAG: aminotransferase class I/II-fold pyridoxal phosphate-dependent enzyme [Lentisphaeraceae bacterium]|nr:aminotransferase class I/II-fold pyridoxal phosphate-dependent enzyme [Lentisphaeraceae bacterium]
MNPLAQQLNEDIASENANVLDMLSDFGKRIFFPTAGILAQAADAKENAHLYNATIGIALENGKAMGLSTITEQVELDQHSYLPYAPSPGVPALRKKWKELQLQKNPTMTEEASSLPVVTNALTHGISLVSSLTMNPGDKVLLSDHFWGNYNLFYKATLGAEMAFFDLFDEEGNFNQASFKESLKRESAGLDKISVILNFPNNPTGYSILSKDVAGIVETVKEVADSGTNICVICDDAYFGLFFEEDVLKESLFGYLADCHEKVLAVKVDGATKEDYVWGLRCGFVTFGAKGAGAKTYKALEQKAGGAIRATVSNVSHLGQQMVLNSLNSDAYAQQKQEKFDIMCARYNKVKEVLSDSKFDEYFKPYPYNSGYFMTMKLLKGNAEAFRKHLISTKGIGVISIGESNVRVAFSCIEESEITDLFEKIYEAAQTFEA